MIKFILILLLAQIGSEGSLRDRLDIASKAQKPVLAIFSARYCVPCQEMKRFLIEPMVASGDLMDVSVVYVDVEKDKEFTERQIGSNFTIPKTLLFFRENGKWFKYELTGYQRGINNEKFISRENILKIIDLQKKRNK